MGYICMIKYPILLQVIYTCNSCLLPLINARSDDCQDAIHSGRKLSNLVTCQVVIVYRMINFTSNEQTATSLCQHERPPIKLTRVVCILYCKTGKE